MIYFFRNVQWPTFYSGLVLKSLFFLFQWQYFVLESMFQDPKVMSMVSKIVHDLEGNGVDSAERINRPTKRNSELLNSLLGLPKNILKSG